MLWFREGARMVEVVARPKLPLLAFTPESHKETRSRGRGPWRPWGRGQGWALRVRQDIYK